MGSNLKTINTPDQDLNLIQSNVSDALNAISGPFIGGQLISGVSVSATGTVINHKLGRQPSIWVLCDQDTTTTIKRTAWNKNSITLQAGAACVVSLWVN